MSESDDGLYRELAEAKMLGGSDGDFFLPEQRGVLVFEKAINKKSATKKTVILVGRILESQAKVAGAKTQSPGTSVKKVYKLSTYEWKLNELKTDLVHITGMDLETLTPKQVADLFKNVFEDDMLVGVAATFDSSTKARDGKQALTEIRFGEVSSEDGDLNDPKKIEERAKEIRARRK